MRMRKKHNPLLLTLLCIMLLPALQAQPPAESRYVLHFVGGNDMFYIPWQGNGATLDSLTAALKRHAAPLRNGQMYVCVCSYAASSAPETSAARMAYLRSNRVKSELIRQAGLTEDMFVTCRHTPSPYGEERLRNVVVVSFPATVEMVDRIAGPEAAARVRAWNRTATAPKQDPEGETPQPRTDTLPTRQTDTLAADTLEADVREAATEKAAGTDTLRQPQPLNPEPSHTASHSKAASYRFAISTNLLRWATLTPALGLEWRINHRFGVAAEAAFTRWSWDGGNRYYALLNISPEMRFYPGASGRFYTGLMMQAGSFNYKLGETGRQGDYLGAGVTAGYLLPVGQRLIINFGGALGYTHARYEKYRHNNGYDIRAGKKRKNYFGVNRIALSLVWTFGNPITHKQ